MYSTRLYSFRENQLPAVNVYMGPEESEASTMGGKMGAPNMTQRLMFRTVPLMVEVYVAAVEQVDDVLDQAAVQIENVLGNTLLDGLAREITLIGTTPEIDANGEVPVGVLSMTWNVIYQTLEGQPEVSV